MDLTAAVREMAQLLGASIPKKVALALDLAEGLPAVEADPAQLRQVVMNLVINAADAIGEREGRIDVRTVACDPADRLPGGLLARQDRGRTGRLVCVEIADTGAGIAQETLAKIFDPFFTTKFTGRGLGLAAVQGIVLRHGGTIAVSTAPGRRARPSASASPRCAPAAQTAAPAAAAPATPSAAGAGVARQRHDPARRRRGAGAQDGDAHAHGARVPGRSTAADGREAVRGRAPRAPSCARCCST